MMYLSYGGGINSTALLLLMKDEELEFEAFYVDHQGDWPETREYVKMIQKDVYPITILTPEHQGYKDIFQFYWDKKIIPMIAFRHCTYYFKQHPISQYCQRPYTVALGFSVDESHRAKVRPLPGATNIYPLIEKRITRNMARGIIRQHDLPLPIRSGCWFCPYQNQSQWRRLAMTHPDLFAKAQALEARANENRITEGKSSLKLMQGGFSMEDLGRATSKQITMCMENQCPYCAY